MKNSFLLLAVFLFLGCPAQTYRVYYHGGGSTEGNPPVDSNEYYTGGRAVVLGQGTLTKNDFVFLGWRDYDQIFYEGDIIIVNYDDVNLYAVWDDDSADAPFSYKIVNGEAVITRYNEQNNFSIIIPETLQNKPVTAIDDNVFSNLSISRINLPKNLKKIGVGSFSSNDISQLTIPDTLEYIGLGAFRNNKLKRITFGTGISAIEPYTFSNNKLTDIIIPDNIVSIGIGAFDGNNINMIKIGAEVDIKNDASLGAYGATFRTYYNLEKRAGLYIYNSNDGWERY